eukprot:3456169-Rhodomonas_salina.18
MQCNATGAVLLLFLLPLLVGYALRRRSKQSAAQKKLRELFSSRTAADPKHEPELQMTHRKANVEPETKLARRSGELEGRGQPRVVDPSMVGVVVEEGALALGGCEIVGPAADENSSSSSNNNSSSSRKNNHDLSQALVPDTITPGEKVDENDDGRGIGADSRESRRELDLRDVDVELVASVNVNTDAGAGVGFSDVRTRADHDGKITSLADVQTLRAPCSLLSPSSLLAQSSLVDSPSVMLYERKLARLRGDVAASGIERAGALQSRDAR